MFAKLINVLFIVLFLALGPAAIVQGCKDFKNSRRLRAEAKSEIGGVIDASESKHSGRFRKFLTSYTLQVSFTPPGRPEGITQTLTVDEDTFRSVERSRTVKIHYLPADPTICAAGEKVRTPYKGLIFGVVMVIAAIGVTVNLWAGRAKA